MSASRYSDAIGDRHTLAHHRTTIGCQRRVLPSLSLPRGGSLGTVFSDASSAVGNCAAVVTLFLRWRVASGFRTGAILENSWMRTHKNRGTTRSRERSIESFLNAPPGHRHAHRMNAT